jgi:Flp pilus assembly protein TadD
LRILASEQPTPDQLAEIAQTALQSGELSDTQLQQLQATLQQTFLKDTGEKNLGMCLGDLYSWGGDWKSAVATYRGVLKADPKHIPALNNMAMVLAMTGEQLNEAIKVINEAIRLSGPRDYLLDTRGIVLLATGAKELAERDFSSAIETAANGYRYFHLAQALQALGRTDEARAALQKALEGGVSASTVHPLERAAFEKLLQQLLPVE